jgi:hypothetical protein
MNGRLQPLYATRNDTRACRIGEVYNPTDLLDLMKRESPLLRGIQSLLSSQSTDGAVAAHKKHKAPYDSLGPQKQHSLSFRCWFEDVKGSWVVSSGTQWGYWRWIRKVGNAVLTGHTVQFWIELGTSVVEVHLSLTGQAVYVYVSIFAVKRVSTY